MPGHYRPIIISVPAWREARRGFKHKAPQGKHTPETRQYLTTNLCCQTYTRHRCTQIYKHGHREVVTVFLPTAWSLVHSFSHLHICTWTRMHKMIWITRGEGGRQLMKDWRRDTAVRDEGWRRKGCLIIWRKMLERGREKYTLLLCDWSKWDLWQSEYYVWYN